MASFGVECREKEFCLDFTNAPINHGSWGAVPRKVMDKRLEILQFIESSPDNWFRRLFKTRWIEQEDAAAEFLGSNPENLVLVGNATQGINCIMKSLPFTSTDAVLINTWTYMAIQKACHSAITRAGGELLKVELSIPLESPEQVVAKYRESLEAHPNIKIAVIDYISSATATLFPIKELTKLCKEFGVMVLIDGAHAPGQVTSLNLEAMGEFGVDFFVGNFHKWVYCPRSSAALWVHPKHHSIIKPVVTTHTYQMDTFREEFSYHGTIDHTSFMCTKDAIQFYNNVGGQEKIIEYNSRIVDEAADMLAKEWNTARFPIPKEMEAPFMKLVEVPKLDKHPIPENMQKAPFGDSKLHDVLFNDYKIATAGLYVGGRHWLRISGQIYNTMEDYKRLAKAVLELKSCS